MRWSQGTAVNNLVIDARRMVYNHRRVVTAGIYSGITAAAYGLAYGLRFEFRIPDAYWSTFWLTLPLLILIRLGCHHLFHVTTERWRFVGTRDVLQLAAATAAGSLLFFLASRVLPVPPLVPRSVILIELVLSGYLTAALWISYRTGFERIRHRLSQLNGPTTPVLIIGAGEAGNSLAREMSRVPTGYRPVGFVDDDASLRGVKLRGIEVYGSTAELAAIAQRVVAQEIVIAVPSAPPAELRRIVDACSTTGLPFKVLPGISEVLAGRVQLHQVRDVHIEDLLGRSPIELELPELAKDMRECSVLITGAAGSIGSELARQVAMHGPRSVVLFDQAETELYYLELELRELHPRLKIMPVVGDIVDPGAVESLFARFRPQLVFHAAAYKHVPMMEANCREAIRNNVIGTWRVADAAGRNGVDRFVLVSTDKAVRPVNVMGATKRMAEMIVMELQAHHPATTYAAVRFGNVLGSNGSVVPIFKKQLEQGKPLTVTHPEVTRYFMTIPEAVQLILQTSLLPNIGGHIAMLEMGEPIRIADLARNLLTLSGAVDRGDDQIVYTGLRPGEKLHEELVAPEEGTEPTPIPKVRLVVPPDGVIPSLTEYIEEWEESLASGAQADVLRTVSGMFPGLQIGSDEEHTGVVFDPFAEQLAYTRSSRQIRLRES
jgi:FlaA1/EpsC-like NDP-sugar epimerase